MQLEILCLDDILGGLEAHGYWLVFKDDVSNSQLPVRVQKDLRLEYPCQIGLVHEIEIRGCKMLNCKNPKSKSVIRMGVC